MWFLVHVHSNRSNCAFTAQLHQNEQQRYFYIPHFLTRDPAIVMNTREVLRGHTVKHASPLSAILLFQFHLNQHFTTKLAAPLTHEDVHTLTRLLYFSNLCLSLTLHWKHPRIVSLSARAQTSHAPLVMCQNLYGTQLGESFKSQRDTVVWMNRGLTMCD